MLTTICSCSWGSTASTISSQSPPPTVNTRPASSSPPYGSPAPRSWVYVVSVICAPSCVVPPLVRGRDLGALVFHRNATERIVLALRVAGPVVGHLDPGQRRVPVVDDPHQVPRLTLVPVGGGVDPGDARHVRVLRGDGDLEPD